MQLGKIEYYGDFFIYPILIVLAAGWALGQSGTGQRVHWLLAVLAGVVLWTFLEYAIHRLILHRVAPFAGMHATHHDAPVAKIGTPSWITLAILLLGVFAPSYLVLGPILGNGVTVGLMLGFFWYICVHHAIHNWRASRGSYLYAIKRHHALHHYSNSGGNFGVTTPLWDHVLKSALPNKRSAARS